MIYFDRSRVIGWVSTIGAEKEEQASVLVRGTNCLAVGLFWYEDVESTREQLILFFNDETHIKNFLKSNNPEEMGCVCHVYLNRNEKRAYQMGALFAKGGVDVTYYSDEGYTPNQKCRSLSYSELRALERK